MLRSKVAEGEHSKGKERQLQGNKEGKRDQRQKEGNQRSFILPETAPLVSQDKKHCLPKRIWHQEVAEVMGEDQI